MAGNDQARTPGAFNLINRHAVQWAATHAAELVEDVDEEQRVAIRQVIVRAVRGERTVAQAAKELRQVVGLTRAQMDAVTLFRRKLEARIVLVTDAQAAQAAFTPTEQEILHRRLADTQARIDRLVERYEGRLLRDRAETIAHTESMRAANRGQQEAWLAARDQGLLRDDDRQVWLVTHDELLCPICEPMGHAEPVPLGQPFTNPDTLELWMGPPIHPHCRCTVALKVSEGFTSEDRALAAEFTVTWEMIRD